MRKVLLSDTLFLVLFTLLVMTLGAWLSGIFVYPFGLLILIPCLLARWLHLYGTYSERANPSKFR